MGNFATQDEVIKYLRELCYDSGTKTSSGDGMCATVFDDVLCWPSTKAGELAIQTCSGDFLKSTRQGVATRQCTEDATWFVPPGHKVPFSNISQCGMFFINLNATMPPPPSNDLFYSEWIPKIKEISYCGYTLSIIFLILSICIFVSIKRLHCSRNKLHINLFISFILRSLMSILKDSLFVRGTALSSDVMYDSDGSPEFSENHDYFWLCKAIISVRYYCIVANFMFMLMEGLYLHNLMFLKLFSDHHGVALYCLLGWGLPFIFIIPWIVLRVLNENFLCWTTKGNIYISLFIDLPIGITIVIMLGKILTSQAQELVLNLHEYFELEKRNGGPLEPLFSVQEINFLLFLIIVRVLFLKLNNVCIQQRKFKYRKLLKATLILIPLFGVPYAFSLLMSIYIEKSPVLEIVYLFFDQSFAAFQGFFAALLYCLFNSEVQIEIKRKYSLIKDKNDKEFRRSRTISNTQQFSLNIIEDTADNENIPVCNGKENRQDTLLEREQQCYL